MSENQPIAPRRAIGKTGSLRSLRDPATLRGLVRDLREGIYITDRQGRILDANPAFLRMLGVRSLRELRTLSSKDLLVHPERREEELELLAREGAVREFEFQIICSDGRIRTVLDTAFRVEDPETGEELYHGILVDITTYKDLEQQLREQVTRDPLTGCHNRRYLWELERRLDDGVATWGAIVCDVDGFKAFNDRHGHHAGDRALVQVGRFLASQVRPEDAVIRFGGDEFLVVLLDGDPETVPKVSRRLREMAAGHAPVTISLGWAVREPNESLESTVRRADRELLRVRRRERGKLARGPGAAGPRPER